MENQKKPQLQVGQRIELFEVTNLSRYPALKSNFITEGSVIPGVTSEYSNGASFELKDYDFGFFLVHTTFQDIPVECRKVGAVTIKSLK